MKLVAMSLIVSGILGISAALSAQRKPLNQMIEPNHQERKNWAEGSRPKAIRDLAARAGCTFQEAQQALIVSLSTRELLQQARELAQSALEAAQNPTEQFFAEHALREIQTG